jgi:hypothetical protein
MITSWKQYISASSTIRPSLVLVHQIHNVGLYKGWNRNESAVAVCLFALENLAYLVCRRHRIDVLFQELAQLCDTESLIICHD